MAFRVNLGNLLSKGVFMAESKIELHDRLRATGLWSEAAAWKDGRIKELRARA